MNNKGILENMEAYHKAMYRAQHSGRYDASVKDEMKDVREALSEVESALNVVVVAKKSTLKAYKDIFFSKF